MGFYEKQTLQLQTDTSNSNIVYAFMIFAVSIILLALTIVYLKKYFTELSFELEILKFISFEGGSKRYLKLKNF